MLTVTRSKVTSKVILLNEFFLYRVRFLEPDVKSQNGHQDSKTQFMCISDERKQTDFSMKSIFLDRFNWLIWLIMLSGANQMTLCLIYANSVMCLFICLKYFTIQLPSTRVYLFSLLPILFMKHFQAHCIKYLKAYNHWTWSLIFQPYQL